ncbi:MAG: type I glutamate--ammonia ligase [Planctomycetota bacterium]|jgi:glutamine synthetase
MLDPAPHDPRFPRPSAPRGGDLEALIGRPRAEWTTADLVAAARDLGVRLVALLHVGGDGWLKTLDFAPQSESHLGRILLGGERADGSSLFDGLEPGASDVVLRPRVTDAFLDPFAEVPTLAVLCGHADRDGAPLPQSPDTIVRRADDRLGATTGVRLEALGEIEFFLGATAQTDVHAASDRGYHAAAPAVFGEPLRREALLRLVDMGIPVKYGHSEVGSIEAHETGGLVWEQHEIELDLLPLPRAADAIVLAQWVLRRLAQRGGWRYSGEPVVGPGHAGNGLHVHFAPLVDGRRARVRDDEGALTDPARWLVDGLVRGGGALMAFGNRADTSLLRLRQAKETPTRMGCGAHDRSALVRLPVVPRLESGEPAAPETVELRLPDGSAHPHLLLAAAAQAMRRGRETAVEPSAGRADRSPGPALPRTFAEVAAALEEQRSWLQSDDVFSDAQIDALIEQLRARSDSSGGPDAP